MKVTTTIIEATPSSATFPRLMKNKRYGFVILQKEDTRYGTVIANGTDHHVLGTSLKWNLSKFEPFTGTVSMSNLATE